MPSQETTPSHDRGQEREKTIQEIVEQLRVLPDRISTGNASYATTLDRSKPDNPVLIYVLANKESGIFESPELAGNAFGLSNVLRGRAKKDGRLGIVKLDIRIIKEKFFYYGAKTDDRNCIDPSAVANISTAMQRLQGELDKDKKAQKTS